LTLPRQALVETVSEAAQKAPELGFPLAMKLIAPEVVHKTESGAVVLGLKSAEEVETQGKRLLSLAKGPAKLLLQEMVQGTEIILGARIDPQYGPFMIVGLGGIFVEVLKDVAIRLLPVAESEAWTMLKELKGYKVLEGTRGQPPRDTAALVKAMVGLSDIFLTYRDHLSDLEFNPIMLRAQKAGLAAVDVRIIRK
jgi:acetate---CoA ligase (ADP-forming)